VITVQEMPENAPPGQLPRSIQVVLENDLVDKCKPGDRIEVNGVFRCRGSAMNGVTNGIFQTQIVATGLKSLLAEKQKPNLSEHDIKNIREIAKKKDVLDLLGRSIAPTIEGADNVKKGLLLQLLGGCEKVLPNGTHLRGDVNVMMVGDPSTAKSQLLRHIMDIAPLAVNTTGRGSSGVGLTAAVTVDKDSGERHLEAGAMVLADRGIVCIDEFDKMNDLDRVAIHEVMEQQTVTIAKAGIHTSLNARCSVIAAANPMYGDYQRDQSVGKNIGLPDSLLSRFDLLYVMLDEKDPQLDRQIAQRVILNHRFNQTDNIANSYKDDHVIEASLDQHQHKQDGKGTTVYDKDLQQGKNNFVTRDFLKKYLAYIKSQPAPQLDDDVLGYTAKAYAAIRKKASTCPDKLSQPVTVRTLETLIRLATAHAKLRYSKHVEIEDCDVSMTMLMETIFQENIGKRPDDENVDMESDDEKAREPKNLQKQRAKPEPGQQQSPTVKKQARVDVQSEVS
jgi:DNA replication licensing factor MCM3